MNDQELKEHIKSIGYNISIYISKDKSSKLIKISSFNEDGDIIDIIKLRDNEIIKINDPTDDYYNSIDSFCRAVKICYEYCVINRKFL